jgi:hypothetical protein
MAVAIASSGACHNDQLQWEIRRGVVYLAAYDSIPVSFPPVIHADVPATITVWTQGRGHCDRGPARTDFAQTGMVLTVEPYDSVLIGTLECIHGDAFAHSVRVTFPEAGTATLRVVGLDDTGSGAVVTKERTLLVR